MKGRHLGLLASLAALFMDIGGASPSTNRRRRQAAPDEVEKAHLRALDRKATLDRLSLREVWGYLSHEERADLRTLRLTRGKLARRMRRDRHKSINVRLRAAAQSRADRAWRQRQEGAA